MTKAERAACLRTAAIEARGCTPEEFESLAASERYALLRNAEIVARAFHRAVAALPNPEKLVAREIDADEAAAMLDVKPQPGGDLESVAAMWAAAHDAAAKWEEG